MKKNVLMLAGLLMTVVLVTVFLASCLRTTEVPENLPEATDAPLTSNQAAVPELPEKLRMEDGVPMLVVHNVEAEMNEEMDIEKYVSGVLAGEMRNDWPMEALKAQAILARTFVLKFVDEKESKYAGADISTDIHEAQAYAPDKINDRIEKAVSDTRGLVLSVNGELPYAWFHAHAGGMTELPTLALEYKDADPEYTQVVSSPDSDKAPTSVKNWSVTFTADEVAEAAKAAGTDVGKITSISLGEKGESGRTVQLLINGQKVSAPSLRLQLDGTRFKSTLLSSVELKDGEITFKGSGYGHGVGMSQWGAYGMAEEGKTAEEIVSHYFRNSAVVKAW